MNARWSFRNVQSKIYYPRVRSVCLRGVKFAHLQKKRKLYLRNERVIALRATNLRMSLSNFAAYLPKNLTLLRLYIRHSIQHLSGTPSRIKARFVSSRTA